MKLRELKTAGHWPTLVTAFLYFDVSFMVWTMLGALGAQIGASLGLSPAQKGLMVAVPILSGAVLRIALGLMADRVGAKLTGMTAQLAVMAGLAAAWRGGLPTFAAVLAFGLVLGLAGASFAVALPQAGRWYPARLQGVVLGLAGAGNIGVVIDSLVAPRLAAARGWAQVFGWALLPAALVFAAYALFSREAPGAFRRKRPGDYAALLREPDAHWFCFYYTVSFGGFVGLASSLALYFSAALGLGAVSAGGAAALCTGAGAMARPVGGALADRFGGIRALTWFYALAGGALAAAAGARGLAASVAALLSASAAFGLANGAVFQLLPQRFGRDLGVMTGLVGCGGGLGGFLLACALGYSQGLTGSPAAGLLGFAGLCAAALGGLGLVRSRWRATWGAQSAARI